MADTISVLMIHNHAEQISLISQMLANIKGTPCALEVQPSVSEALECLDFKVIDIILLDLSLIPNRAAIQQIRTHAPQIAIVVLIDMEEEADDFQAIGAQDYVLKSDMSPRLLELTLRYALEQKRSQEALRKSEGRLNVIIESIKDFAIFSMDLRGYINFWNSGAEHILGYTETEIIGQHTEIIFTPEDRAKGVPMKELSTAAEYGSAMDERWHVKKDGILFYGSGITHAIYNELDDLIGFTKVARDLTERHLAYEQREILLERALETRAEAEHANEVMQELLALISHELKNPLSTIVGFASMITSKTMTWSPADLMEFATIIEEEARKMNDLLEQLTDHARQRTGTLKVDFEPTFLEEIIQFASAQLRALTLQHHLVIDIPLDLPPLYADRQRMGQVLTNLVGNAVRYSATQTQVTIQAHVAGDFIQVDVSDEGRGIPIEQRQKVFEPFHQVERLSTKGIGLGLALCKNLVERHKGQIWIQDHAGHGTIVSFTLPIAQDKAAFEKIPTI